MVGVLECLGHQGRPCFGACAAGIEDMPAVVIRQKMTMKYKIDPQIIEDASA